MKLAAADFGYMDVINYTGDTDKYIVEILCEQAQWRIGKTR